MANLIETAGQIRHAMGGVIFSMCKNEQVVNEMLHKIDRALSGIDILEVINERMLENVLYRCFEKPSVVRKEFKAMIWASLISLFAYSPGAVANALQVEEFFLYLNAGLDPSSHTAVDPFFLEFVRYMRVAQLAMPPHNNQGNLLLICAYLESNGRKPVLDYSTGSGKTDAVKRRLVAYHWFAAHTHGGGIDPQHLEKANRYIAELEKSHKKGDVLRKTGNQPLIITLEDGELAKLVIIPRDFYDEVLASQRPFMQYELDPCAKEILLQLQICFSDIPYFSAIMAPPLTQLILELITWFGTHRAEETIPNEMKILEGFVSITGKGEEKMIIVIAMMACKVLVLQKASATFGAWVGFPHIDLFGLETPDLTTQAAIDSEREYLTSFIQAVVLANELCASERLRNKQIVLFEIGQRLEASGRVYSKGGGESAATKRRLKIISTITGRVRAPRATATTTAITALPPAPVYHASSYASAAPAPTAAAEFSAMDVDEEAAIILTGLSMSSSSSLEDAMQALLHSNISDWMLGLYSRHVSLQSSGTMSTGTGMSSGAFRQFQDASSADHALSSGGRMGLESDEWNVKQENKEYK